MAAKKITFEQDAALAAGRGIARSNQRRAVAARRAAEKASEERAAEARKVEERERELRNGFAVGDRVSGRDYFWNERRTGVIVEGSLTDGVPVACDDGETRVLYRASLEAWVETHPCSKCEKPMNPVEWMLGPVCGDCVRKRHAAVAGGRS